MVLNELIEGYFVGYEISSIKEGRMDFKDIHMARIGRVGGVYYKGRIKS